MFEKIQALGKEIILPTAVDIDPSDTSAFLSILRDLDADLAGQLDGIQFFLRAEGSTLVAYRDGAVMG